MLGGRGVGGSRISVRSSPGERREEGGVANAVKRSYSRFILKVESRQLADRLDVGDERKRGLRIIARFLT